LTVGGVAHELGFSQVQASTTQHIVRLDRDRLAGMSLGEFEPYEPEFGNLVARGHGCNDL
jgi:hypothetical protein